MTEQVEQTTPAKRAKPEVQVVKMTDGREVSFVGKRKVLKDASVGADGFVTLRMDFRNGETRSFVCPPEMLAQFAAHGMEQKYGDELATTADKPLSEEDMVLAVEELDARIQRGEWKAVRESSGTNVVSGASVVIRAIMEATGKDAAFVKAYLEKKQAELGITRKALYDSFKNPATKIGAIIARMEAEKLAKAQAVDADAELAALTA